MEPTQGIEGGGAEESAPRPEPENREEGVPRGHIRREQEGLWNEVLSLADYVEEALKTAIRVLFEAGARPDLIAVVRAEEVEIDRWEVRIERECLRALALYDLVASDLRRVVAAMRVNRDLEGLADLAENLAKRARKLGRDPLALGYLPQLRSLAEEALGLVDKSLLALRSNDADLARRVILEDNAVDRQRLLIVGQLKQAIRDRPESVDSWLRLISSARNLERAADHATNIAESVVYVKEGVLLRRGQNPGAEE
jgi:phosphate transport system protein